MVSWEESECFEPSKVELHKVIGGVGPDCRNCGQTKVGPPRVHEEHHRSISKRDFGTPGCTAPVRRQERLKLPQWRPHWPARTAPWGKVVPSRLLEVEKPTSGERATSCLPRVSLERQAFCLSCPLNLSPRQNLRCPSRHFTLSKSFHVHRNFHQLLSHGNCTGART